MSVALGPIASLRLVSHDAERLADFYAQAFGFAPVPLPEDDPVAAARLMGLAGTVSSRALGLGRQTIELLSVAPPGRAYPEGAGSADTAFQHVALVVADMDAAMAGLSACRGWSPISTDGPEHLPASSGGVSAFKFRDPEGHPLEFLQFPKDAIPLAWSDRGTGLCLGFDHSAIAVAETAASLAFYARLGLARDSGSLNRGIEQARMDGVPDAVVEVTGLAVADAPPHLELLCYRGGTKRSPVAAGDVAATQIAFMVDLAGLRAVVEALPDHVAAPGIVALGRGVSAALLRDPDGHRLLLRTPPT